MKQLLLICAVVALVGCWKKEAPKGEIRVRVQRSTPYQELPKATVGKLIANPIVEKAIRKSLKKPTGELTEANLEKVKELYLGVNKLTDVKGLEKLTQLTDLGLKDNPDLTKAQIAELQKALPKCKIYSNLPLTKEESAQFIEAVIRKKLKKPIGELTKADMTKVTRLDIRDNGLTDVKGLEKLTQLTFLDLYDNKLTDVKGLEKLTQLTYLSLSNNPDLTKAQINQLKKTLPKCLIGSNPTK